MSRTSALGDETPVPEADALSGFPHPRLQRTLYGHDAEMSALAQAARGGRLHHGLLITGPKGVGKATLAWRFARAMLSHSRDSIPDDLSVPSHDRVSAQIDALSHPDALLIRRPWDDRAKRHKTDIPVDEIRKLGGFFGRHAAQGGWRIAIVDAADEMSRAAENALLKTLEEPPPRALLILIANAVGALLPTTRSRCRKLALKPLPPDVMARTIAALDPDGAAKQRGTLIALAEGSPGKALALGQGDTLALYGEAVKLLRTLHKPDLGVVTALADRLAKPAAAESFRLFVEILSQVVRWMILARAGRPEHLLALGDDGEALLQTSHRARLERWTALWDTWAASFARVEALNLDKRHAIADAFLEGEAALR